ncbi:acetyl-CoA carboxylase carboxyltransferase subunit alpha [Clostridium chauvoei]|uniref:Acetyl-coenzyme A carboxylase carboxyl transferase subunit alpha n=2 Tax=Clostridium chauvoei TaxID=46867 RepID=A0A1U6J9F2_9CLOT|nr:acetyl-CoA carboxylase carboxyltransferase subunit alpha [Clostridium chauvoei]ATD54866.1 acetyl-CoA carboxylase carboxyltransferase subunit alpha [Clostridium chauvoei]ATD57455.1 acetyl-CoA carboxylase carboxyltransferase subunit alpha [Clostridium chauvoei]MBX7280522.1 acetyl-CoA carboxylase carboxyltransferase subunit alpha [Clostridium chauvoei]MBX7283007.1 acetyl-CoA carboxylase carboxyltransferase subunit alpha [Clostridium chauvoei]MBX7285524.1 acetyl-CoA carboxylase carboxyltransfer
MSRELIRSISVWDKVNVARHKDRPNGKFYIDNIFENFIELHGDRNFGDDKAIIGGIASINNKSVTVIAITKGENTKENIERNFGMPNPEGYRKALRLMKQAEKFNRPVICFVDTPGAFCGIGAEERGQGQAIAQNLMEMSRLKTPIISIIIGEGGSGGALALAVADKVFMLEHSIYSILSPEGFASILWKDGSKAKEAAEVMKITAQDLREFKIIDKVIREPRGGAHKHKIRMALGIKKELLDSLKELENKNTKDLLSERYDKFRKMGNFT